MPGRDGTGPLGIGPCGERKCTRREKREAEGGQKKKPGAKEKK
ncbi:hypothetical protein [Methanocella paludicola]|nr:hypothetical protein [Methanocella paludicola]